MTPKKQLYNLVSPIRLLSTSYLLLSFATQSLTPSMTATRLCRSFFGYSAVTTFGQSKRSSISWPPKDLIARSCDQNLSLLMMTIGCAMTGGLKLHCRLPIYRHEQKVHSYSPVIPATRILWHTRCPFSREKISNRCSPVPPSWRTI